MGLTCVRGVDRPDGGCVGGPVVATSNKRDIVDVTRPIRSEAGDASGSRQAAGKPESGVNVGNAW